MHIKFYAMAFAGASVKSS